ncbi:RodZ domain-containing protein [Fluviibacterium sp. DFM31]|uniref:RodZ domain-containing protein n=1 Tax=Meridianimarinicoccus marinus TaxID=3231483 RepID=A0ABV3L5K6_9RHOB
MTGRSHEPGQTENVKLKSFDDFELTLGDIMRGERATLGKSLLDVQRDIKIKAEYIAGIEDTDLSVFETPGFINGYVRAYARYLGMNADWVYQRFCEESGFSHVAGLEAQVYTKTARGGTRPARRKTSSVGDDVLSRSPISSAPTHGPFHGLQASAIGSLAVLCLLVAGLGYGGWSLLQEIQRVTLTPVETPLTVALSPTEAVEGVGLAIDNAAPTPAALERLYRPKALDTPVLVPRDGPIAMLDPDAQGVYAPKFESPLLVAAFPEVAPEVDAIAEPEVQVVAQAAPELVLFARRPAWVRVRAADGSVLLEKIMEQGERFVLPATEEPPTLRAGNSGSVYFAVNGETLGPAGPGTSVAKNVVLSAEALSTSYQVADLKADPELARLAELVIVPEASPIE